MSQLTDSNGLTETYGYDSTGNFLTTYTDRYGTTTYTYVTDGTAAQDNALAEIAWSDDTHMYFTYDSEGRLIDQYRDGGADAETFTYLSPGGYTETDGDGNTTTTYFNLYGATAESIDPLGNATYYEFDSNLNLVEVDGPQGTEYTYTYDANGNLISETDPLGNTTQFAYDANNNLTSYTDAKGNTTSYAYDSSNDLLSITYANGTEQQYTSTWRPTPRLCRTFSGRRSRGRGCSSAGSRTPPRSSVTARPPLCCWRSCRATGSRRRIWHDSGSSWMTQETG